MLSEGSPRERLFLAGLMVVVGLSLAACGPRTIRTLLWPERYVVTSTVNFRSANGSAFEQTQQYVCQILDTTDTFIPSLRVDPVGERHWMMRRSGAILVLGATEPCPWEEPPRKGVGHKLEALRLDEANAVNDNFATLLFNDAENPTTIDAYDTFEAVSGEDALATLEGLVAGKGAHAPKLTEAYPNLMKAWPGKYDGFYQTDDLPMFQGLLVTVYRLKSGTECDPKARDVVVLPQGNVCRDVRVCDQSDGDYVCADYGGALRPEFSADFTRADIPAGASPDRAWLMRFYSPKLTGWTAHGTGGGYPEVCYGGACSREWMTQFYDPQRNEIIEALWRGRKFHLLALVSDPAPIG